MPDPVTGRAVFAGSAFRQPATARHAARVRASVAAAPPETPQPSPSA
ncbi:hypothetical protein [Gandjariella thermophila]|nr:hypothetical protein [Gandjariella thermophila]